MAEAARQPTGGRRAGPMRRILAAVGRKIVGDDPEPGYSWLDREDDLGRAPVTRLATGRVVQVVSYDAMERTVRRSA